MAAVRVRNFGPTVFSVFGPLAIQSKAINLGQGFPDWKAADWVKEELVRSVTSEDANQYCRSMGHIPLVQSLSSKFSSSYGRELNAMSEICVTVGATEAGFVACQAFINPGDEVISMEPFYDMYPAQVTMAGGVNKFIPLRPQGAKTHANDWLLDLDELEAMITPQTKAIWLNNPHNPLGKVFTQDELQGLADLVLRHPGLMVFSDEVYDELVFEPGLSHVRLASLPGMWDRVITIGSAGKTFSVSGWKVGWIVASEANLGAVSMAQQYIPFCVSTPCQDALSRILPKATEIKFLEKQREVFRKKKDIIFDGLEKAGLRPVMPAGGYFVMADYKDHPLEAKVPRLGEETRDFELSRYLTTEVKVAPIPCTAFYSPQNAAHGENLLRFAFCKEDPSLVESMERLQVINH